MAGGRPSPGVVGRAYDRQTPAPTTLFDAGDSQAGMSVVSDVESDQQGRDRLDRARIGERAAVNVTTAGNRADERADALFGLLVIAANNDVTFNLAVESGERL